MVSFDLLAPVYDLFWIPSHPEPIRQATADVEGPGVDLGGGTGRFTEELLGERSHPLLVDRSRGMLSQARRAERDVGPVQADGAWLPLADASIGVVTITEAFHHFAPDQHAVLADIARVLRDDGVLVVEEIDPDRALGRAIELGENLLLRFGSRFHTPAQLTALAEAYFHDVRTEPTGRFTYIVEAREPIREDTGP